MPVNIQRRIHLGKGEVLPMPFERIGGIGSRLTVLLFLERWILSAALKEVHEGAIQVAKGLLDGNRGNLSKPGIVFLEIRESSCQVVIGELLTTLFVSRLKRQ
jgi:hypothetical protein